MTDCARALTVAFVGFIFNVSMMIMTTLVGFATNSTMMFVMASQHLLDALGDILVMWRFWGDPNDPEVERYDIQGAVIISFLAAVACLYVFTSTIAKLMQESHPEFDLFGLIVGCIVLVFSTMLGVIKLLIAQRLNSHTLHLDAITSLFVATLALVYIGSELMLHWVWDIWMFEHIASMVIAFGLLCYALYNLMTSEYDGAKWYQPAFWMTAKHPLRRGSFD